MTTTAEPIATANSVLLHPYVVALNKPLGSRRTSPAYFFLSMIVAALMILLPLIYLGLIGLSAYFLYWHVKINGPEVKEQRSLLLMVLFAVTVVGGGIAVLFMLKPIFAWRRVQYRPQPISRKDQPLLFAYVERLCEVIGAPKPAAIYVDMDLNASAALDGFFAGVLGGRVTLQIGLPYFAGLTLQEATGVLAHEFGHFTQRGGMRINHFIRAINFWFARIVYKRDAMDQMLYEASHGDDHWTFQLIAIIARGAIWLSRRVLWLLMVIGELFSRMLMRAMEFDADACEARVVGSTAACEGLRKVPILQLAIERTYSDLTSALHERRLPENVPQLVINRLREMPAEVRDELRRIADREKTTWLSTHPSQMDRTSAVLALREPGVFKAPAADASALFSDFETLSKKMTLEYYRAILGKQFAGVQLVPVATIEKKRETIQKQAESLQAFFGDLLDMSRPVFFPQEAIPNDEQEKVDELLAVRKQSLELMPAAQKAALAWNDASTELLACEVVVGLWASGISVTGNPQDQARAGRVKFEAETQQARKPIDAAVKLTLRRVQLALALSPAPKKETPASDELELAGDPDDPVDRVMDLLNALQAASGALVELRVLVVQQRALLRILAKNRGSDALVEMILSRSRKQIATLDRLRQVYRGVPYPFSENTNESIERFALGHPADAQNLVGVIDAAAHTLAKSQYLYARGMATLAERCEKVEDDLGLARISFPAIPQKS